MVVNKYFSLHVYHNKLYVNLTYGEIGKRYLIAKERLLRDTLDWQLIEQTLSSAIFIANMSQVSIYR